MATASGLPSPSSTHHEDAGADALRRLRCMLMLRAFEAALMRQPKPGFQLLSRGEEAVAVGVCDALRVSDPLLCSGRSIAIALARGIPPGGLLAELIGKDGGPNKGRAGRAHVSMPSIGLYGAHGVVAGNLSVAAGVALAQQYRNTGAVTCCVFGDGACGAGALHEAMNIAALWKLPLLFVCDNNGYAVSTAVHQGIAARQIIDLAAPFGIPATAVDGADIEAVAAAMQAAVQAIRAGSGPRFIEMRCTRMGPHSTATKEERPAAELEHFRDADPIRRSELRLRQLGWLDDAGFAALQAEVSAEIAAAEQYAAAAPWPDCDEALRDA